MDFSPNEKDPAQREAYEAYVSNKPLYNKKVREQAARNVPAT